MKNYIYIFFLSLVTLVGCKNDIDVNAPWQETAVVYGLLDLGDTAQYIRVEKIFQNSGMDAIKAAQVGDSLYLDSVKVEITAYNNGSFVWKETLEEDRSILKNPGVFATSPNILYKLKRPLNIRHTYEITVSNPRTGYSCKASTPLVGSAYIVSQPKNFIIAPFRKYTFTIFTGTNAVAYDLKAIFTYREYDINTLDSTEYNLEWIAVSNLAVNSNDLYPTIIGRSMFDYIALNIPQKNNIYRKMVSCQFDFVGGGSELLNYININKPGLGIVQKKPEYTNLTNGLGLFSSRNTTRYIIPANDSINYFLKTDSATMNLGFKFR